MLGRSKNMSMPAPQDALPGRQTRMPVAARHFVLAAPLLAPFPAECEVAYLGLGCFWGAEKCFWKMPGVYTSAVGYAGGSTPNPTYQEVCSGLTGHNEVVMVVFDAAQVVFGSVLKVFWESHNPTQGMRQGNDVGTQYRSGIYCTSASQLQHASASLDRYQASLTAGGFGPVTTEVLLAPEFYYAEEYHQQYLAKNPNGYCGLGGTGVSCAG